MKFVLRVAVLGAWAIATVAVATPAFAGEADLGLRRLALGTGEVEPLFRAGLDSAHRLLVSSSATYKIIDPATGKMRVRKTALAVDVGKAINPDLVNGQIVGGMVQGLATVLYEDMRFDDKGRMLNPNFTDYKIPTAMDIPDEIVPIIVEVPQPDGPYGARGVGEHTMIPAAPMVANAVEDALGLRITEMPVTAERVALAAVDSVPE